MNAPALGQAFQRLGAADLSALVETVVLELDEAFWPILAVAERIDLAAERLPLAKRRAIRADLDRDRQDLLFDRTKLAAALAVEFERRLAATMIVGGGRP